MFFSLAAFGRIKFNSKRNLAMVSFVDGEKHTNVESDNAPYLNMWNGEPKLNYNRVDNANPHYGSISCDSLSSISKISKPATRHFSYFL